jgi:hypothetical protein
MCYKNFARWGSNTKCFLIAVLLFCLSAPEERYSCRKYVFIAFEPQRGNILVNVIS